MTTSTYNMTATNSNEEYVNPFEPTVFDEAAMAQQELDEEKELNELANKGLLEGYQF